MKVLILCTGNSCRSQMAEGYLKSFLGAGAEVHSAGIERHGLNPMAVEVMREDGVDISAHTSNLIQEYEHLEFDYVITVCDHARERCPVFPAKVKMMHKNFPDPAKAYGDKEEVLHTFRNVRDSIKSFAKTFLEESIA